MLTAKCVNKIYQKPLTILGGDNGEKKKRPRTCNTKYSSSLKLKALSLADDIGSTNAARQLKIPPSNIYSWRKKVKEGEQP